MAATSTTRKIIRLRYAGTCGPCGATLPVGTEAVWDKAARAASCVTCPGPSTAQPTLPSQSVLVAGSSARAEYERRQQKRERKLEAKWGRFAGVAKALSEDPQSTRAWARGADYERRLADDLARLLGDRAVFLHDRKVGRANIDHLVVARSGVWVVDAKNYNGRVEHRSAGGWLGPVTWRIYVDGRDRTKLATGLEWQVGAVRQALVGLDVPIHSALCFPFKCWGMFARPFRHDGVLVTWSKKLAQTIDGPGELGPEQTEEVVARLDQALRPAT